MGKFVFLAVFFAALMAASVAQDLTEQSYRDVMCRREVQQKPLNACRQILQDKLIDGGREGAVGVPLLQTEWDTRERCCRQLHSVSRGCRCSAIRGMVRDYEETMPPLGGGRRGSPGEQQEQGHCSGETAGHHQQGGGYHGEEGRGQQGQVLRHEMPPRQQQEAGQEYYGGETAESQPQGGIYYGETSRRQGGQEIYGEGAQQMQHVIRVRLMQARQYVAGLPTVCQIEPMECSVFSGGQY
uniref:Uncharacterized protein n=1 Tax=Avena sativa TaxID=4498 RepID=A0ACD5T8Y0_AVESA